MQWRTQVAYPPPPPHRGIQKNNKWKNYSTSIKNGRFFFIQYLPKFRSARSAGLAENYNVSVFEEKTAKIERFKTFL